MLDEISVYSHRSPFSALSKTRPQSRTQAYAKASPRHHRNRFSRQYRLLRIGQMNTEPSPFHGRQTVPYTKITRLVEEVVGRLGTDVSTSNGQRSQLGLRRRSCRRRCT